jgi:hypothetical protein
MVNVLKSGFCIAASLVMATVAVAETPRVAAT